MKRPPEHLSPTERSLCRERLPGTARSGDTAVMIPSNLGPLSSSAVPTRRNGGWAWLTFALLAACGDGGGSPRPTTDPITAHPRFDPTLEDVGVEAETWLRFPFPADFRRQANGNVDLSDFPNPGGYTQLEEWVDEAQSTIDGFSIQGMAYLAFDAPIDTSSLPTTPDGFLLEDSPAFLVDLTPGSPTEGERVPLRFHYFDLEGLPDGYYVARDTLALGPAWGFPLREGTTYALVVRDTLRAADGGRIGQPPLLGALLADAATVPSVTPAVGQSLYDELRADYGPLRAHLAAEGIDPSDVVVATVFTTQTYSHELDAIAQQIREDLPAPTMTGAFLPQGADAYFMESFQWNSNDVVDYAVYSGNYAAPNYQEGTIPYVDAGGAFHFVAGTPTKTADEAIRFVLTVPDAPPDATLGCHPIVIYGHGTGGSRNSFRYDDTAGRLAARGMAAISIDMPLHGVRAQGMTYDVDLMTFNFYNAAAFRTNFRQGAVDLVSLVRFVRESLAIDAAASHTGQAIQFCDDRVGYMGHSQGGLTASLAIPFLPEIDTFMLSGAGGGLGITLINRDDIVDFGAVLAVSFEVPPEEDWGEEHPIITLAQTMAEISDPSAYARYWNRDAAYRTPAHVMLTSGEQDAATPYRTATTLALAAHMPVTLPVVLPIPEYGILGLVPAATPLSANGSASTTLGMLQFTDDLAISDAATHFLVFHRPEAIDSSMEFLRSGMFDGTPVIRRNASADVR